MKRIFSTFILTFVMVHGSEGKAKLEINRLTGDFYIFTTYNIYINHGDTMTIPANGMYLVTDSGVVMFDTPWDTTQFQALLDSIQSRHQRKVKLCIATHFHEDRTGGLAYYSNQAIMTYTSLQTLQLCKQEHQPQAKHYFVGDTTFHIGSYSFSTFYPGAGHAPDNIVIWFANERILYGGCFIKSIENNNIGNLSDANVPAWESGLRRLDKHCRNPAYVIPGHYGWGSNKTIKHTMKIVQKYLKNHK